MTIGGTGGVVLIGEDDRPWRARLRASASTLPVNTESAAGSPSLERPLQHGSTSLGHDIVLAAAMFDVRLADADRLAELAELRQRRDGVCVLVMIGPGTGE